MSVAYEPTPEQIRAACLEIQADWSESERCNRAGYAYGLRPISNSTSRAWGIAAEDVEEE
jgi:hypothetical protein